MMANNYCPECDKDFKNISGLNGHNQFKHNKLPESLVSHNPTGRTVAMLELMKGEMVELKWEIRGLRADLEDEDEDEDEDGNPVSQQEYICEGKDCGSPITQDQVYCPKCGHKLDWNGVRR
jgi:DNA-directed RNA polymerase subunit RPC12/RpoP